MPNNDYENSHKIISRENLAIFALVSVHALISTPWVLLSYEYFRSQSSPVDKVCNGNAWL